MEKSASWAHNKVYDWKNYVTPARPSNSELKILENYIKKLNKLKKSINVAILGSTVEFRSLCHKYGIKVTLIEFKMKHYDILSKQKMKYVGKENVWEEDWKNMRIREKFDLILGDLVLNVGSIDDINKILKNLSLSLDSKGYCILRTWVRKDNTRLKIKNVLKNYNNSKIKTHFYTSCVMPLYMCYYNFKKDNVDYPAMIKGLKIEYGEGNVSREDYLHCYQRWRHEGGKFVIPLKTDIEKLMKKYFKIKNIKYGSDSFKKFAPIYVMVLK